MGLSFLATSKADINKSHWHLHTKPLSVKLSTYTLLSPHLSYHGHLVEPVFVKQIHRCRETSHFRHQPNNTTPPSGLN